MGHCRGPLETAGAWVLWAMLCAECVDICITCYKANLIDWQHHSRCELLL